jgi:hypothetical protein
MKTPGWSHIPSLVDVAAANYSRSNRDELDHVAHVWWALLIRMIWISPGCPPPICALAHSAIATITHRPSPILALDLAFYLITFASSPFLTIFVIAHFCTCVVADFADSLLHSGGCRRRRWRSQSASRVTFLAATLARLHSCFSNSIRVWFFGGEISMGCWVVEVHKLQVL